MRKELQLSAVWYGLSITALALFVFLALGGCQNSHNIGFN